MSTKKLQLKALQRNSPAGLNDGGCDEFINFRLEKGAFRPIGKKDPVYPKPPYSKVVVHRQGDFENWIGVDGLDIEHYNPVDTSVTQSLGTIEGELYDIRVLKNFLIVLTSSGLTVWLWSEGMYSQISLTGLEDRFDVHVYEDNNNFGLFDWTDVALQASDNQPEALYGVYVKRISELSAKGQHYGAVSYRVALRLFDGSYILATPPRFFQLRNYDMIFRPFNTAAVGDSGVEIRFGGAGLAAKAQFDTSNGFDIEGLRQIVSSIDLFVSKIEPLYDLSPSALPEDVITDIFDQTWQQPVSTLNARDYLTVNPDFKTLNDQPAWYRVASADLGGFEGVGDLKEFQMEVDMENFYHNYASRPILPIEGFTHHGSTGEVSYVYNNRLILGDTKQTLGIPDVLALGQINSRFGDKTDLRPLIDGVEYLYQDSSAFRLKSVITLDTEAGAKSVVGDIPPAVYQKPGSVDNKAIFLESMSGYYDGRAKSIEILISVDNGATYKSLTSLNLLSSKYSNFSVIPFEIFEITHETVPLTTWPKRLDANFESWQIKFSLAAMIAAPSVPVPANDGIILNPNGRQVSNVNNPLFYDAANYQDVSIGKILAFGSNTDPISSSQFGQYPLYNFTTTGIWASQVGTGEIFLISDVPVNGEVILSKEAKVDLSLGTVYATLDGLKILSGREPVEISTNVEGQTEDYFIDNEQLQEFLSMPQTVDVASLVDKVPFTTYLLGAKIGFSKGLDDEEIYIANPNYDYAYMFDLDTKLWSKVKVKVESFVNMYPELFAIGETNVINMSREVEGLVPLYFHTKPLSLDAFEEFKKLRRSFLRGFIQTAQGKYAAFYLFSSDDLINWRFETGNDTNSGAFNNIWCTHSWDSKRFYVFVFAVEVDYGPNKPTWINGIELEYDVKWNSKLR